jgi:ankyrin repeat protein
MTQEDTAEGYLEIIKELIKAGADLDEQTANGDTALIIAARLQESDMVKELVNAGANVTFVDKQQHKNAYEWARFFGDNENETAALLEEKLNSLF